MYDRDMIIRKNLTKKQLLGALYNNVNSIGAKTFCEELDKDGSVIRNKSGIFRTGRFVVPYVVAIKQKNKYSFRIAWTNRGMMDAYRCGLNALKGMK